MSKKLQKISRSQSGFTLIEVLVGILIIAATATTVFYGVNYARAEIRKIVIRERALQELSGYMDYWVARINHGEINITEANGDNSAEEVVLYNPMSNDDETMAIIGTITREPITDDYSTYNSTDAYYFLAAKIEWVDHLSDNEISELYLETKTFKFK